MSGKEFATRAENFQIGDRKKKKKKKKIRGQ